MKNISYRISDCLRSDPSYQDDREIGTCEFLNLFINCTESVSKGSIKDFIHVDNVLEVQVSISKVFSILLNLNILFTEWRNYFIRTMYS